MTAAEDVFVSSKVTANPFKFLDYYDENDQSIFAGRNEQIVEILASFSVGRTFVLYGRSGLGKTSLLRAGILPRMRDQGYVPIYVRILDDPVSELCAAVAAAAVRSRLTAEELPEVLAGKAGPANLVAPYVLILDQFEEFFIRFDRDEAKRGDLTGLLGRIAAHPDTTVHVLFTLREDYLANMDELRPHFPDLMVRSYRLLPLSAYGARQAILTTLNESGVKYDDNVVTSLVNRLESVSFSPLVLQIYCTEVFEEARKRDANNIRLTLDDVHRVGEVSDIYRRYLEGVTQGLTSDQTLLIRCLLDVLKTADQTKRAVRIDDLSADSVNRRSSLDVYFTSTHDELTWALEHLCGQRLVRRLPTRDGWYELLHDGIVHVLDEWLSANRQFRHFRDAGRLIDALCGMTSFLSDGQLRTLIDPCRVLLRLTPEESEFVYLSSLYEQSESVAYWARRYDETHSAGASQEILLQMLGQPEHRLAAAVAAGRIGDSRCAEVCRDLALTDSDAAVRRAAGAAFAKIASDEQVSTVSDALRLRKTRAIELLAALEAGDRDLSRFSSWTRWLVRRWRLRLAADLISSRAMIGTFLGFAAAVGWSLVILTPLVYLWESLAAPQETLTNDIFKDLGGALLLSSPLWLYGLWIGRRTTIHVARDIALEQSNEWRSARVWDVELVTFGIAALLAAGMSATVAAPTPTDVTRWISDVIPPIVITIFAIFVSLERRRTRQQRRLLTPWWTPGAVVAVFAALVYWIAFRMEAELPVAAFGGAFLCWLTIPHLLKVIRRSLGPSPTTWRIAASSILAATTFGVIPFFLVLWLMRTAVSQMHSIHLVRDLLSALVVGAALLSFRVPVSAFTLAYAEQQYPAAAEVLPAKQVTVQVRRLLLVPTIVAAFGFLYMFGPHCLPLLPEEHNVTDPPISITFPRHWLRTEYVRLESSAPSTAAALFQSSGTLTPVAFIGREKILPGTKFILGRRPALIALTGNAGGQEQAQASVSFASVPISVANLPAVWRTPEDTAVIAMTLTCKEKTWQAFAQGTLPAWYTAAQRIRIIPIGALRPAGDLVSLKNMDLPPQTAIIVGSTAGEKPLTEDLTITGNRWTYTSDFHTSKGLPCPPANGNNKIVAFAALQASQVPSIK